MHQILKQLSKGLIVSCQPVVGGHLDEPDIVARFALAALSGGALKVSQTYLQSVR